jgi:hypothetical protein
VSLLARLELAGIDVGARWNDVAGYLLQRQADHVLPFLDLQYLYGLARAGAARSRCAAAQHRGLCAGAPARRRAPPGSTCACRLRTGSPPMRAAISRAPSKALGVALPRLLEIGGSHAQRDLFEQVYLDALVRTGSEATLTGAQSVLQQQLNGQPESLRLRRQAGEVY